jgi:hypothetical protein
MMIRDDPIDPIVFRSLVAPLAHPRDTGPPQSNMAVEDSTLEFDDFSALMFHYYSYLVGGLEHLDYFSIYWECHHPN